MPRTTTDKPLCGAQRTSSDPGVTCTLPAGWGTDHVGIGRCRRHGGNTKSHRAAGQVALIQATALRLGVPREVDPAQGILELVWEAAGNVEFYRQMVAGLPAHPLQNESGSGPNTTGIYGPTFHQSGIPTGEAKPHVLVQMYDAERDRLERYVKDALAAKVDERRVQLAEAQARDLFADVAAAMREAHLTTEQSEAFSRALANKLRTRSAALTSGPARVAVQQA